MTTLRAGGSGPGSRSGSVGAAGRRRRRGRKRCGDQRRVLCEDRALEVAQCRAWLDAQLVDQRAPGVLIRLQRLGLAPGPVQRPHELAAQPLAQRMSAD